MIERGRSHTSTSTMKISIMQTVQLLEVSRSKLSREHFGEFNGKLEKSLHIAKFMGTLEDHLYSTQREQSRWFARATSASRLAEVTVFESPAEEEEEDEQVQQSVVEVTSEAEWEDGKQDGKDSWIEDIAEYPRHVDEDYDIDLDDDMPMLSRMESSSPPPLYHSEEESEDSSDQCQTDEEEIEDDERFFDTPLYYEKPLLHVDCKESMLQSSYGATFLRTVPVVA